MAVPLKCHVQTTASALTRLALLLLILACAASSHATLPSVVSYSEDFTYAYGSQLNSSAAWDGTATSEIVIAPAGYYVKVIGGSPSVTAIHSISPAYAGQSNIIWVHFKAMAGPVATTTAWNLWLNDASGNNLARFYGAVNSCRGRIGGSNTLVTGTAMFVAGWNDLDVKINTLNNTTEFFCNGASMGVLDHTGAGDTLAGITISRLDNGDATGEYIYLDELRVGQEPLPTVPPAAPAVTSPTSGSVIQMFTPTIQWSGETHDKYEVHVNTTNDPADANSWDSGQVTSSGGSCVTGALANHTRHYVFVRLRNAVGWGNWSAAGCYFDISLDPPLAPNVTSPANGALVQTQTASIAWTGDAHDMYEVHVNTTNNPDDANGWDSGQVASAASSCTSGALSNTHYYVFVRLRNALGWGPWSAVGRYFDVNVPIRIIPEPQQLTWKTGASFQVNAQTQIVVNSNPDSKDTFTANQLRRKVWDTTGFLPAIVQGTAGAPTTNVIAIGDPARNAAVASIIAGWPEAVGKASKSEGYLLGVKDSSIVIRGFDQAGTFYGCQTLIQMLEYYNAAPKPAFCYDYPEFQLRGTMVRLWDNADSEFFRELISEVMARFKLNVLQMDMGMGSIWPSHPELYNNLPPDDKRANPITMPVAAALADYAKQHFIQVIPAGPSWSHADGLITCATLNTLLRENRAAADPAPSLETLCHRNPDAQAIMHDLWNDMITYFDPNYIHTGWDEISDIGHSSCPYCHGVSKTTLFNEFLTSDRDWLAARGVGMVMWADMLRPDMNGGGSWNLSQVAATMPKDIILEDWEYTEAHDNDASVARWNSYGLPSCGAPYGGYNPWEVNIYNWGNICDKYNTRGLVAFNKYRCGTKAGMFANSYQWMEVGNMIFYGEWAWTPGKPNVSPLPYDGETMVRRQVSPDKPVSFGASLAGGNVNLTWTNPTDTDYQATWICYRVDRYPTDPTDGIPVADVAGTAGAAGACSHILAPAGATIYYAAFSHDSIRHFSPVVTASVNNGSPLSMASLSSMPDGKAVNVGQCIVTGAYNGCFYVENADRACGLRVESTEPVAVGDIVTINGILGKTGTERSLTALSVAVAGQQNPLLRALAIRNSSLGGAAKGSVPGSGTAGVNNVGLLVTTVGRKLNVAPDGSYFFVDDGSIPGGVKVVLTGAKTSIPVPSGTFVAVTGACSLDSDGKAVVRPRSVADIVPVQ